MGVVRLFFPAAAIPPLMLCPSVVLFRSCSEQSAARPYLLVGYAGCKAASPSSAFVSEVLALDQDPWIFLLASPLLMSQL